MYESLCVCVWLQRLVHVLCENTTFLVLAQQHHLWFVHGRLHQGGPHVRDTDVVGRAAHRVLGRDKTSGFMSGSHENLKKKL